MAEKERRYYADGTLAYELTRPVEEEYFYSVDPSDLPQYFSCPCVGKP